MPKTAKIGTVTGYIGALDEPRRGQIERLHALIRKNAPKLEPHVVQGMIGYGRLHYHYDSGREGDAPAIALASRKAYISVYVCAVEGGSYLPDAYRARLGKADVGKGCIRFRSLEDVDLASLAELLRQAAQQSSVKAV